MGNNVLRKSINMVKNHSSLFLLAAFWGVIAVAPAREVLSAEYSPAKEIPIRDARLIFGYRGALDDITPEKIRSWVEASPCYETMHPKLKKFVDRNIENYYAITRYDAVLYNGDDMGIRISMTGCNRAEPRIIIERYTLHDPDDCAMVYEKEKPINPKTKKPWIRISASEMKQICAHTETQLSEEEQTFIRDLLAILNENFHYAYGMKFVRLEKEVKDNNDLIGKYVCQKGLYQGPFEEGMLPEGESAQKIALSERLGRPIYDMSLYIDPEKKVSRRSHCGDFSAKRITLKNGKRWNALVFNSVSKKDINPKMGGCFMQAGPADNMFKMEIHELRNVLTEKGVDLENQDNNKTAFTLALYAIFHKAQTYMQSVIEHEHMAYASDHQYLELRNENWLGDVVPLPEEFKLKLKTEASTKKKAKRKSKDRSRRKRG